MNAPLDKNLEQTFVTAPHFPIYMDYSATTPIDPRVADKMIPYLREQFGNPASRSHMYGWTAEAAVEEARADVAALVNADPREIIWTYPDVDHPGHLRVARHRGHRAGEHSDERTDDEPRGHRADVVELPHHAQSGAGDADLLLGLAQGRVARREVVVVDHAPR